MNFDYLLYLQAMSAYGFEIVQTLIVDIEPDAQVKRAMNEINAGEFPTYELRSIMNCNQPCMLLDL